MRVDHIQTYNSSTRLELQSTIVYSSTCVTVTTAATLPTSNLANNGICYDSTNSRLYTVITSGSIYSITTTGSSYTALSFTGKFTSLTDDRSDVADQLSNNDNKCNKIIKVNQWL